MKYRNLSSALGGILAGGVIVLILTLGSGTPNPTPSEAPVTYVAPEPVTLPALSREDAGLLERLSAHIGARVETGIDRREERWAAQLLGKNGFGGIFIAALTAFVWKCVEAAIAALILALIVAYIKKHWIIAAVVYVLGVILPSCITARLVSRK